jgi:hypothetical protein
MERTWRYVNDVIATRLSNVGVTLNIITAENAQLINDQGFCNVPAYAIKDGKKVKFRTHCSGQWKKANAFRWLKARGVNRMENWVGIASDEARRARESTAKWVTNRYPLVELGYTRERCVYELGKAGWPMPKRSSCVMCPLRSMEDWREMRAEEPDDFARACEIDEEIRSRCPGTYIHQSMRPLINEI